MTPKLVAIIAALALTACDTVPMQSVAKAFSDVTGSYQDQPFDAGTISVIAPRDGKLATYNLRPCGLFQICGARRGKVSSVDGFTVVTGAYSGRTFYLSAGGDGFVRQHGPDVPLAWE